MSKASAPTLTSDHVNYLIWRYLQETGHGQAAARLQGDWLATSEHPSTLPFAQHVQPHALISLVQKGLEYNKIDKDLRNRASVDRISALETFFGTAEGRRASLSLRGQAEDDAASSKGLRKHGRNGATNGLSLDLPINGPAPKRSRRSETQASINGDAMQIDQNGYHERQENGTSSNNYSPADANGMEIDDEQPATPSPEPTFTLTHGESKGIQSEKPVDLTDQTTIQTLASATQTVLQLVYNPHDPTIIATTGDALARIWHTSETAGASDLSQMHLDILPSSNDAYVSCMSWSPDGEVIAVASRSTVFPECAGAVTMWTKNGKCVEELPATHEIVLMLRWNPAGTQLLGITSSGDMSSSVIVWDISDGTSAPTPCQVDHQLLDVVWKDDSNFVVCGHGIVAVSYISTPGAIALEAANDNEIHCRTWSHIRYDSPLNTNLYAAEEQGYLALLSRKGEALSSIKAHETGITALEFQPLDNLNGHNYETPRLLATSSTDGTAKIWNAKNLECLNVLSLGGLSCPALALSFTSDGRFLAAANPSRILIWDPKEQGPPKATWKGELGKSSKKGSLSYSNGISNGNVDAAMDRDSAIGDDAEDEQCSLSWDAEGKRLAMGSGSQFAVINFAP